MISPRTIIGSSHLRISLTEYIFLCTIDFKCPADVVYLGSETRCYLFGGKT